MEGEHSELFKGLFSQIRKMNKKQLEEYYKCLIGKIAVTVNSGGKSGEISECVLIIRKNSIPFVTKNALNIKKQPIVLKRKRKRVVKIHAIGDR